MAFNKSIIFTLILFSLSIGCTVSEPRKVVCRNEVSPNVYSVSVYTLLSKGRWLGKTYLPREYEKEKEYSGVVVYEFEKFDFKSYGKDFIKLINQDENFDVSDSALNAFIKTLKDIILNVGDGFPIISFERYLSKPTLISTMYCPKSNYVRTFKIDKITQLEIDRKDYHLDFGTYCEDFLSNDEYFFKPKR